MSTTEGASSGNELDRRTAGERLLERVGGDDFQRQVEMALPPTVSPRRFVRATMTALLEKPDLVDADQASLFSALIRAAQLGLMPDGREAAINVYRSKVTRNGREEWIQKAELLPMIGGYRKIAADHGWTIRAAVVFANDEFEYEEGLEPRLRHVPVRPGGDRGDRVAVYAVCTKRGEEPLVKVLYADDVARAAQSAKTDKVWKTHTDRMWEKTAGKLAFKSLPLGDLASERVERILEAEATFERTAADPAGSLYGPTLQVVRELPASTERVAEADGVEKHGTEVAVGDTGTVEGDGSGQTLPPVDEEPATVEEVAPDEEAAMAALEAGQFELGFGKYRGQTLEQINETASSGDSKDAKDAYSYLGFLMRKVTDKPDVVQAVWAFCRVYQPALFHEVLGEKETGRS